MAEKITDNRIDRLTTLFLAQSGLVAAAADRYAPTPDHVDDVVQQVYVDFLSGVADGKWDETQWKDENDVGALLYQIAKRKAQMLWREYRHQRGDVLCILAERLHALSDTHGDNDSMEKNEKRLRALGDCIRSLSAGSRKILEQHYFDSLPMKTIADRLGKEESAVYQFFYRLRKKLRQCIEGKTGESR